MGEGSGLFGHCDEEGNTDDGECYQQETEEVPDNHADEIGYFGNEKEEEDEGDDTEEGFHVVYS